MKFIMHSSAARVLWIVLTFDAEMVEIISVQRKAFGLEMEALVAVELEEK